MDKDALCAMQLNSNLRLKGADINGKHPFAFDSLKACFVRKLFPRWSYLHIKVIELLKSREFFAILILIDKSCALI